MDENDENKAPSPRRRVLIVDSGHGLTTAAMAALVAAAGMEVVADRDVVLAGGTDGFGFDVSQLKSYEPSVYEDRPTFKRQGGRDYESVFRRKRSPRRR